MPDRLPHQRNWQSPILPEMVEASLLFPSASFASVVEACRGSLVYLATPYSKVARFDDGEWDPTESLECATRAARKASALASEGVTAVSPIIQAVEMIHADLLAATLDPFDIQFWETWCRPLLEACSAVVVPPIAGWDASDGIWGEVVAALQSQKRVFLIKGGPCGCVI